MYSMALHRRSELPLLQDFLKQREQEQLPQKEAFEETQGVTEDPWLGSTGDIPKVLLTRMWHQRQLLDSEVWLTWRALNQDSASRTGAKDVEPIPSHRAQICFASTLSPAAGTPWTRD